MDWIKRQWVRRVAAILAFTMLVIGGIPAKSLAYMVDTNAAAAETRQADLSAIQRVLETRIVSEKLVGAGLSVNEAKERLSKLSDGEVHQFASQLNSLYPGGDAIGIVVVLLLISVILFVLLRVTDKKVIIR